MIRRTTALAAAACLVAFTAPADQPLSQLQQSVARELERYDIEVDVRTLSPAELSAVHHIAHSGRSEGSKRGLIKSAVGNGYRLRDLFFN